MEHLLAKGYNQGPRPSGHVISDKWGKRQKGSIPANLIMAANTRSSDSYIKGCKEYKLEVHPVRFVDSIPEFFIKFLRRKRDIVLDPFSGSNVVGAVAERLQRRWISVEINKIYVVGSAFRFDGLGEIVYRKYKNRNKG